MSIRRLNCGAARQPPTTPKCGRTCHSPCRSAHNTCTWSLRRPRRSLQRGRRAWALAQREHARPRDTRTGMDNCRLPQRAIAVLAQDDGPYEGRSASSPSSSAPRAFCAAAAAGYGCAPGGNSGPEPSDSSSGLDIPARGARRREIARRHSSLVFDASRPHRASVPRSWGRLRTGHDACAVRRRCGGRIPVQPGGG